MKEVSIGAGTVDFENRCPLCGEDRAESIRFFDNGKAQCKTCGKVYKIKEREKPPPINTQLFETEEGSEDWEDDDEMGKRGPRKKEEIVAEVREEFMGLVDELEQENAQLKQQLDELKKALESTGNDGSDMLAQLEQTREELHRLEKENEQLRAENGQLRANYTNLNIQYVGAKQQIDGLKAELEHLRSQSIKVPVDRGFTVTSDGQTIQIKQPSGLVMSFSFEK